MQNHRTDVHTGGDVYSKGVSNGITCGTHDHNVLSGSIGYEINAERVTSGKTTFSLLINDVEIDSVVVELRYTYHDNSAHTYIPDATAPPSTLMHGSSHEDSRDSGQTMIVTVDGTEVHAAVDPLDDSFDYIPYHDDVMGRDSFLYPDDTSKNQPDITLLKISNKLACLMMKNRPDNNYTYKQHVSPDGGDSTEITKADTSEEYGTFNPKTGEIIRNQSASICFV